MNVSFKNPHNGKAATIPTGFSWTFFFFGWFVPLLRGDWKNLLIIVVLHCMTLGLSHFVFMFIYNGMNARSLVANGYLVEDYFGGSEAELLTVLKLKTLPTTQGA